MIGLLCTVSLIVNAESYQTEKFTIEYDKNISLNTVKQLANRVAKNREVVLSYLQQSSVYVGTPINEHLIIYVSKKRRTPYQDWNTIHIPEKRVLAAFSDSQSEHSGMAIIHELTHVYAVSAFRKQKKNGYEDRFYDDGLAVFLQHRFGGTPEYPDFGTDLYRAVAEQSAKYGSLISLTEAEDIRHSAKTGTARKLAYLQEGAFTQFIIERYGLDIYLKLYQGGEPHTLTGKTFSQLEKDWIELINVFAV